jgi:hypothetical protein
LALAMLAGGVEPAAAANPKQCGDKQAACYNRCVSRYPESSTGTGAKALACMRRTCDHQYDNCMLQAAKNTGGGTAGKVAQPTKGAGPKSPGSGVRTPLGARAAKQTLTPSNAPILKGGGRR